MNTFHFLNIYSKPFYWPHKMKLKAAGKTHILFRESAFFFIIRVWTRAVHVHVGHVVVFLFWEQHTLSVNLLCFLQHSLLDSRAFTAFSPVGAAVSCSCLISFSCRIFSRAWGIFGPTPTSSLCHTWSHAWHTRDKISGSAKNNEVVTFKLRPAIF